jgi:hypothetical protein
MEGTIASPRRSAAFAVALILLALWPAGGSREAAGAPAEERPRIELRKTPLKTRQYQGKNVEGEERVITRGDSLWRILVQEKGLPEKRFGRYMVVVQSLNPHIKNLNLVRVGDTLFIPVRPDEILGIQLPTEKKGEAKLYRVKKGDHLYKILREQLGLREIIEIRGAAEQVKELNPGKKNWNLLFVGEPVWIPGPPAATKAAETTTTTPAPQALPPPPQRVEAIGLDYGQKISAEENLKLIEALVAALGHQTRKSGEEILPLTEGTVRIDRESYPVVQDPKGKKKVILDVAGKIPPSLGARIERQTADAAVVSPRKGSSLHDAVTSVLTRLGFSFLPANRPVAIRDGGVGVQVRGEWMVTGPEEGGGGSEVFVITLTDPAAQTPDYLRDYLSLKGMSLKEILIPSSPGLPVQTAAKSERPAREIERWPGAKEALVDAFLNRRGVNFTRGKQVSLRLRAGINMDMTVDRHLDLEGKPVALFFHRVGDEVKKALEATQGLKSVELDLASLNARDLIAALFAAVGEPTPYREHHFAASEGAAKEKVVVTVAGFFLPQRSLLVTDREIPKGLERFFADRGVSVVRF